MSDVPSEIYREILIRLPPDSVFRCRSVCKTWLRIIDDSSFIKSHTNNQLYNHTLLVRNKTGVPLYSFSLDSLNFISVPQEVDAICIKQLIRDDVPRLRDLFRVAFCNGLILISHEDIKKIWGIWNPLTMDCHELPPPNGGVSSLPGFGFGYDVDADDYKAVRIDILYSAGKRVFRTLVYSLKSDSWSRIEDCPDLLDLVSPGVFLNGVLYWGSTNMIIALNLTTESYSQFPLPPVKREMLPNSRLDALDGCLIFSSTYYPMVHFDGWVMEDNGVEKLWIKLFSLRCRVNIVGPDLKLVAYMKSKRQVVLQHQGGFFWCDVENNSVKKFSIDGSPHITSSQICPGSLVRLSVRDSAIGFGAVTTTKTATRKRKRKSKKRDTRLKICVKDGDKYCSDFNCSCCPEKPLYWMTMLESRLQLSLAFINMLKICARDVEEECCSDNCFCSGHTRDCFDEEVIGRRQRMIESRNYL